MKDEPADTGYDAQYDNQGVYVKQEKMEEGEEGANGGSGGEGHQGGYDNGGADYQALY